MHVFGGEVFVVLHLACPSERVIYGLFGVEGGVGDFEFGLGVGGEVLDERRVGIASPEIHRVDINVEELVCYIPRVHVAETLVYS